MKCPSLTLLLVTSFIVLLIRCTQSNIDGFLSINCGASTNRTDSNGELWISDIPFTRSRNASFIHDASITDLQHQTFAYFPNLAANKYCYLIPAKPGTLYLVRATFSNGAFETGVPLAGVFDLFINGLKWFKVRVTDLQGTVSRYFEVVLAAKSDSLNLCLARNSETEKTNYLFISTIELRPLKYSFYNLTDFHKNALVYLIRRKLGSYYRNLTNFGLSGDFPPIIASLAALTHLMLGSNNLSGSIPDLSSLKNLTTLVTPPSNFPAVNKTHKMKNWIVGCLVGAPLIVVLLVTFLWKYIHRPRAHTSDCPIIPRQETHGDEDYAKGYHRLAVEYTEEEIKSATNNYSTLIGKGGFGLVFLGKLSECDVAVKKLSDNSNQGQQEFKNEVSLLCRLYHKNLVNLIGYCKQPIQALVYEYMPCGTLKDHLYGTPELEKSLDWNTRLNIALQAAEGLLYLHQACNPPIIHRDIKCTNILLDGKMTAKVADFGLAKLLDISQTNVSTGVKGTLGYLDPEYFRTWSLTTKSDVYSFGVVLLEIISGKPPSDEIVAKARELLSCGKIAELMDSSLGGRYKLSSAWKVAEVAYACVAQKSTDRPTMSRVVEELKEAVAFEFNDSSQYVHIPETTLNDSDSDTMPTAR